jgi:hypothetical protein
MHFKSSFIPFEIKDKTIKKFVSIFLNQEYIELQSYLLTPVYNEMGRGALS